MSTALIRRENTKQYLINNQNKLVNSKKSCKWILKLTYKQIAIHKD